VAQASVARQQTEEAFLDAAERLLVSVGYAGITTRGVAEEAGANHGLVHYYFGSMENLLARVNAEWRAVLREAFAEPRERYGIEMPLDALVSLVMTFNEGIILERLSGIEAGQAELLGWIDDWLGRRDAA
jgi:AcrR family transcriptional regulator